MNYDEGLSTSHVDGVKVWTKLKKEIEVLSEHRQEKDVQVESAEQKEIRTPIRRFSLQQYREKSRRRTKEFSEVFTSCLLDLIHMDQEVEVGS